MIIATMLSFYHYQCFNTAIMDYIIMYIGLSPYYDIVIKFVPER